MIALYPIGDATQQAVNHRIEHLRPALEKVVLLMFRCKLAKRSPESIFKRSQKTAEPRLPRISKRVHQPVLGDGRLKPRPAGAIHRPPDVHAIPSPAQLVGQTNITD